MATSVFCTRSSSAFSTSNLACSCLAGPAVFKLHKASLRCSVHTNTQAFTHVCLAESSSSREDLTAALAFIATAMDEDRVTCHGCKNLSTIASSWSRRAAPTCVTRKHKCRSQLECRLTLARAFPYRLRALLSRISGPKEAAPESAARLSAWGSVLGSTLGAAATCGAGMLVPLRLAAAKEVTVWATFEDNSPRDSWTCCSQRAFRQRRITKYAYKPELGSRMFRFRRHG
jgi:hypothetical protein